MSEWACRDPQGAVAISNPAAAAALLAAAAAQGHAGAAYQLGYCYEVLR
jgi:TPR repeat protein